MSHLPRGLSTARREYGSYELRGKGLVWRPARGPGLGIPAAIWEPLPIAAQALSVVLGNAGFEPSFPNDPAAWALEGAPRVALVAIDQPQALLILRSIREVQAAVPVVGLLPSDGLAEYVSALQAGYSGAVPKKALAGEVVEVVRAALRERALLPQDIAVGMAERLPRPPEALKLSEEEADWLRRLGRGQSVQEMARELGYSRRSMHRHLATFFRRLGARNRSEAVALAARWGLIEPPPTP